ncbi:MAG TPA: caspase family protein [Actinokineospora sp.]|nr:caspase family protein [Actinokineospora sp.]
MARLPDPARSRAVLIGVDSYTDPTLSPLPSVAGNLAGLRDLLTSPHGTGLPDEHCVVLSNPRTPVAVDEAIHTAAAEAEDMLLVYYAGHGEVNWRENSELYLTVQDTNTRLLGSSAVPCARLRRTLRDAAARTRVLVLDCCFAGRAITGAMGRPADVLVGSVDVEGIFVLAAVGENEAAMAPPGEDHTLFTGELVKILRDGIANEPALLTLEIIYRQLKAVLARAAKPEPSASRMDTVGDLALAHNPANWLYRRLSALRTDIEDLAAAEARTAADYALALDKIVRPELPALALAAAALRARLSGSDPDLDAVARDTAAALAETRRVRAAALAPLELRDRERGRLRGFQAIAVRLKISEKPHIIAKYERAESLLWTKPCDLAAAGRAVDDFQNAVIEGEDTPA